VVQLVVVRPVVGRLEEAVWGVHPVVAHPAVV
jgi:hypothetical protein